MATTLRQKAAVSFIKDVLNIEFEGNINNNAEVSQFLSLYLQEAKDIYDEIKCEYEAYMWDLMND